MLIYVREGVPFKELSVYTPPKDIECGIIEISLKKQKLLLFSIYRPPSQHEKYFFEEIGKGLDFYSSQYESICLIGDFNCEPISFHFISFHFIHLRRDSLQQVDFQGALR